jgi:pyridoxine 5-phosphate synthase
MIIPRLGVNIDHVATVRNARGGAHPDPLDAARAAISAGADGITMHLREDRRHIRDTDVERFLAAFEVPLNLEMAATAEMTAIACRLRPHAACLVPERRAEVTTEGGLDAAGQQAALAPVVAALGEAGIRVSLFIDPDPAQLRAAAALRAPVVELHTGAYADGRPGELDRLRDAAALTAELGLECHAGHGLTFANVSPVAALPEVMELNIGHFLIGQAILDGLPSVVQEMCRLIRAARSRKETSA